MSLYSGQLCFFVVINKNGGWNRIVLVKKDGFFFDGVVVYFFFCGFIVYYFCWKVRVLLGWLDWFVLKKCIFGKFRE